MRFTIKKKLYIAFGLTLSLIIALGGVSLYSGNKSQRGTEQQAEMLKDLKAGEALMTNMIMLRMKAKDFLITNSDSDAQGYESLKQQFEDKLAQCEAAFQNP